MAQAIATVNIALRTSTVSRAGFGTPIFISSHRAFNERIRTYTSLTAVGEDFQTSDPAYIAALGFFSSTPSTSTIKIGRREADMILTPVDVVAASVHAVTVIVNDGDAVSASYTAVLNDEAEDVVDALVTAINTDTDVAAHVTASKVGTGTTATLMIAPNTNTDLFTLSSLDGITQAGTSTETAATVLQEVRDVDDDFYFVTADDHTEDFVVGMATAVQATEKLYFVSTQEQGSILSTYSPAATDVLGILRTGNFSRTVGFWSQDADSMYRECNYVGVNAPYSPDTRAIVWSRVELEGVPIATNAAGNALTGTQQQNLDNRYASYIHNTLAGVRVNGGKTSSGAWIDNIRTLDNVTARVREGQVALIANQNGSKVAGNASGILSVEGALKASLAPFIASGAANNYIIDTSNASIDVGTRTLSGVSFDMFLSGGIISVSIDGNLIDQGV